MPVLFALWTDDRAEDVAEYALMLAVLLVIVIATVQSLGRNANTVLSGVASKLAEAQ